MVPELIIDDGPITLDTRDRMNRNFQSGMYAMSAMFVENAASTQHQAIFPIPAGAQIVFFGFQNLVEWGAGTASIDIGDTADPNGWVTACDIKTGAAIGTDPYTYGAGLANLGDIPVASRGAYFTGGFPVGPTVGNFGLYYAAGSNLIATVAVGTPGSAAGRTRVTVLYTIPATITPAKT